MDLHWHPEGNRGRFAKEEVPPVFSFTSSHLQFSLQQSLSLSPWPFCSVTLGVCMAHCSHMHASALGLHAFHQPIHPGVTPAWKACASFLSLPQAPRLSHPLQPRLLSSSPGKEASPCVHLARCSPTFQAPHAFYSGALGFLSV